VFRLITCAFLCYIVNTTVWLTIRISLGFTQVQFSLYSHKRHDINVSFAVFFDMKERDLVHGYFSIADKMQPFFFCTRIKVGTNLFLQPCPLYISKPGDCNTSVPICTASCCRILISVPPTEGPQISVISAVPNWHMFVTYLLYLIQFAGEGVTKEKWQLALGAAFDGHREEEKGQHYVLCSVCLSRHEQGDDVVSCSLRWGCRNCGLLKKINCRTSLFCATP